MIALFNKFRPQTFEDVVGQENVVAILKKSIETNKIAHGYLFIGNRGLGKTTLARIFSKALNCTGDGDRPCNECESCVAVNEDKSMDVIELDAASNRGVDTVRDVIINKVGYKPRSRYKVYIIDECHMFTTESWNAMLKTLESPPDYCIFIFCTTNPEKIPKTIISRVQTFKLKDIGNDDIVNRLKYICKKESIKYTTDALYAIARYSKGGMRDSISALDQLSTFEETVDIDLVSSILGMVDDDVCCELFKAICEKDYGSCVTIVNDLYQGGKSISDVFDVICSYTRSYIKLSCGCKIVNSDVSDTALGFIKKLVDKKLLNYHTFIKLLVDGERNLRYTNDKQLAFLGILSKYVLSDTISAVQKVGSDSLDKDKSSSVSADSIKETIKSRLSDESADDSDTPVTFDKAMEIWFKKGKRGVK